MKPPRMAALVVAMFVAEPLRESLLGDLDERFVRDQTRGRWRAWRAYWRQAIAGAWHLSRRRAWPTSEPVGLTFGTTMNSLLNDLRLAGRTVRRSPGYSAIAILTLALAIGANTLLFSLASPLVVRPLPIANPDGLGWVRSLNAPRQIDRGQLSMPDLVDLRERAKSFTAVAGYENASATLTGHQQDPERVTIIRGTANLTDVWGMRPVIGRLFQPQDGEPGQPIAAVLANHYWKDRFQSDPSVIGRQLLLNGKPLTVVGVMPSDLELGNLSLIDMWTPMPVDPNGARDARTLRVLGRLAPGATIASANAEVEGLSRQWAASYPATHHDWTAGAVSTRTAMTSNDTWLILLLLAIVVGFVLLIACANLANLVMARLVSRRVDLAVRQALGASRAQLVRPMMAESLVLSLAGGALGLGFAHAGLKTINAVAYEPFMKTIAIDGYVLVFVAAISFVTPLIFCLLPALSAGRSTSAETLRDSRTSGSRGSKRRRSILVAGQVALALSLLVVSTLAVQSMLFLNRIDTGIAVDEMATFRFELPADRYATDEARARFAASLSQALSEVGGISAAAVISHLPVFDGEVTRQIEGLALGGRDNDVPWASWYAVTPGYFRTAGVNIVGGRGFGAADAAASQPVAIINRTAADKYFGGAAPAIGRQVTLAGRNEPKRAVTVVGVAADTRAPNITVTSPQVYVPFAQWPRADMTALVRASTPADRTPDLRAVMRRLDSAVPISNLRTVKDIERDEMSSTTIINGLFIGFAVLALTLAAGGLYGVISYSVGQRTREIGVRMALGADPSGIRRMVLSDGLKVTAIGAGAGLLLGLVIGQLAAPVLYGVSPHDPATLIVVTLTVLAVSILAVAAPAVRAMKLDPARTLRGD
ncbi:MAG: ABC transporter permease [Acidobacteria bacterium]|nr:MAG: ABC transporter permease [Acidobacteriota bacterium]